MSGGKLRLLAGVVIAASAAIALVKGIVSDIPYLVMMLIVVAPMGRWALVAKVRWRLWLEPHWQGVSAWLLLTVKSVRLHI